MASYSKDNSPIRSVPTGSGVHPAFQTTVTVDSLREAKFRGRKPADLPPPSTALILPLA